MLDTKCNPTGHPADRLLNAIADLGSPVCVGLDPVASLLPDALQSMTPVSALATFGIGIIRAIRHIVPCVKIQSACYERYGADGMRVLADTLAAAKAEGVITILDGKRGDIGISAEHYAHAMFHTFGADWATVNAYLGVDGVAPFLAHGGAFALVRTSNPGSDALQSLQTSAGISIAETVADLVANAGKSSIGSSGYSALGAVVGATKAREAAALRMRMPEQMFLVPGFGAQGGRVGDVIPCFNQDGRGAIVTASRSVIFAAGASATDWISPIKHAAEAFAHEIRVGIAPATTASQSRA